MNDYKKWTGADRERSLRLVKKAKAKGLLSDPCGCSLCGRSGVTIQEHCEDYDATLDYIPLMLDGNATDEQVAEVKKSLIPLCIRCHQWMHRKEDNPEGFSRYITQVIIPIRKSQEQLSLWGEEEI